MTFSKGRGRKQKRNVGVICGTETGDIVMRQTCYYGLNELKYSIV